MLLGTKERILTIRLLEKVRENPAYADLLGIEVTQEASCLHRKTDSESAGILA